MCLPFFCVAKMRITAYTGLDTRGVLPHSELHMWMDYLLLLNGVLLGLGLAADAFTVALSNGLNRPSTSKRRVIGIATAFACCQLVAPMIGWAIAYAVALRFSQIELYFSIAAVCILVILGIKMLAESCSKKRDDAERRTSSSIGVVIAQCAATSVDALTIGFTIEECDFAAAAVCSTIISAITFAAYIIGFFIGKKFGMRFGRAATAVGGILFLAMAAEVAITAFG